MPNNDGAKARAQSQFKKAGGPSTPAEKEKSARDATVAARDAKTERLKGLRLERDQAERDTAAASPPPTKKSRSPKPVSAPRYSWGDLNIALNALVSEAIIVGYQTNRVDKKADEVTIEVTVANGADQAQIVRRVRQSLPEAFSGAAVRTRTA